MQIWSFHLLSGSKTIPWKFHILRTKNSRVIYPNKQTFHILGAFISKSKQCYNAEFLLYYFHVKTKILIDFRITFTLWPLFMDVVRLVLRLQATTRKEFTFFPRSSWYSFNRPREDERLSWLWSHPEVLKLGPLDWESSGLTTTPLLHKSALVYL